MVNKAVILGLAVYRVTKQFPEGEVLIGQLRQSANEIIRELTLNSKTKAVFKIKVILNYLEIGQNQQWTKKLNFVILKREYSLLIDEIKKNFGKEKKELEAKKRNIIKYTARQKKILDFISENEKVKSKDVYNIFPGLHSRTVRRDLKYIVKRRNIKQNGQGRSSFYTINKDINKDIEMSQ